MDYQVCAPLLCMRVTLCVCVSVCRSMAWCVMVGMVLCVLLPPLDVQDEDGCTAAMMAACKDCLTALIENKADLDIQVRRGSEREGGDDPWPWSTACGWSD